MSWRKFIIIFTLICFGAFLARSWQLGQFPSGLHYDEAWFGYNSFLIKERGINIYNEKWPIDVDFFGEHVSAAHAYWMVPFISTFGLNAVGVRATTVFFSLATLLLGSWLIHKLTQNKTITLLFALLFSLSPLNIIMSRASSTVIIDTFFLTTFLSLLVWWLDKKFNKEWQKWLGLTIIYASSVVAYVTYFSSRLLIPVFAFFTLTYFFIQKKERKKIALASLPIILYVLVPFLILLPTPFARGRFDQTTVINNQTVRFELTNNILRLGQAGWSTFPTRVLHNKVSENARAFLKQYITFLSPNPSLFQIDFPTRYRMPSLGAFSLIEYFGFWLCLAYALFHWKGEKKEKSTALLFVMLSLAALIPTALTVDDFPNWQRAVIVTPFFQMSAALGLYYFGQQFFISKKREGVLILGALLLSIPSLAGLAENYTAHARYFEPFHRDVVGWKVGEWINTQPRETKIMAPSVGIFLYPYFQSQQIIPELSVEKSEKHFILAPEIRIDSRLFVRKICGSPKILTEEYDWLVFRFEDDCQSIPWWLEETKIIEWEDGTDAVVIGKPNKNELTKLLEKFEKIETEAEKKIFLQQVFSKTPPSAEKRT